MGAKLTADELADEIVSALDGRMVFEETDRTEWLGASSVFQDEVIITVGDQRFELTIEEVTE